MGVKATSSNSQMALDWSLPIPPTKVKRLKVTNSWEVFDPGYLLLRGIAYMLALSQIDSLLPIKDKY